MPCGMPVVRRKTNNYKAEPIQKSSRSAYEWLNWIEETQGLTLRHDRNNSEKRIGDRGLPVDGWCPTTNTVYQFHGCWWHACDRCQVVEQAIEKAAYPGQKENWKKFLNRRQKTEENDKYIRECGHNLVIMRECQWSEIKRKEPIIRQFVKANHRTQFENSNILQCEKGILDAIRQDLLFGVVLCDATVPDQWPKDMPNPPKENPKEYFKVNTGIGTQNYLHKIVGSFLFGRSTKP